MNHYSVEVAGVQVEVAFNLSENRIEATIGNRTYRLEAIPAQPGVYWFNWEHRYIEAIAGETAAGYVVSLGGYHIPVELLDARKALRRAVHRGHEGVAEVNAPMPGKIVRILVTEGSEVEANQGIVVMEAMKMQNEIKSPKRGRIRKLSVVEGAAVSSGDSIALVE